MRDLTSLVATSIDGFIAAPDGDITPLLVNGPHLEALIERYPETFPAQLREPLGITAQSQVFDTDIMGANTYRAPAAPPTPASDRRDQRPSRSGCVRGGRLAASLSPHLDRLLLQVNPVILGRGPPLFRGAVTDRPAFHPAGSELFTNGVLIHDYRPREAHQS